ncbi:MAG: HD-GYP domain-containing protein [Gemmatimonadota bacterium]
MTHTTTSAPLLVLGRDLVQNLLVALRSAQLYEPGNATMRASAGRLERSLADLFEMEGAARIEGGLDILLVNDSRIRSELRTHSVHTNLLRFLKALEIGGFNWTRPPTLDEVARFARAVGRLESGALTGPDAVAAELAAADLRDMDVMPVRSQAAEGLTEDPSARARAERTYRHSVAVTQQLMESLRAGRSLQRYKVKRGVQQIVDSVLEDETLLLGLTNLRDFDEPTFTHSVNVCIFSVALGQKIGLSRLELYDLGMAALMHDLGKVDVPREILSKVEKLTSEEWAMMQRHAAYGCWRIAEERAPGHVPVREMLVAFEHHLNVDLSGYPRLFAPRQLAFYSKIVAIADSFDAGTTPRVYKTDPISPADMLQVLNRWKGIRYDPILLKAFIALLGIYPPGCLCLLDTFELAVVMSADEDLTNLDRPRVKLIADVDGSRIDGPLVSLAEKNVAGEYLRTVIKVVDPERYGIDIGRHFLGG